MPRHSRLFLSLCILLAFLTVIVNQSHAVAAQEALLPFDVLGASDPELKKLVDRFIQGENLILGVVDGEAITTESIKGELGMSLDARVNTWLDELRRRYAGVSDPPREQLELSVIYYAARAKAIEIVLQREAERANVTVPDALIDAYIVQLKKEYNIDPMDAKAWARCTIQNFNRTPNEYRDDIRIRYERQRVLEFMAGRYGPIPGLQLPVFYPLDVTPKEMRERYETTKEQWKSLVDIRYSRLAVAFQPAASVDDRNKYKTILEEGRRRLQNGESIASVTGYLKSAIAQVEGAQATVAVDTDVSVATDATLESSLATRIRSLKPGEISDVVNIREKTGGENEPEKVVFYIVKLHAKREDISRLFADPVVQRELQINLMAEKLDRNIERVQETLIERAVIIPKSLRLR
ncbi:MAG: hypothetical protein L6Q71_00110 [Planctomycetes bacterium]|nr:hypothetical protein [Planctomycetota bacterium]NUQ34292.1 hypothetical protein [Planctomycetaceae bacterium]